MINPKRLFAQTLVIAWVGCCAHADDSPQSSSPLGVTNTRGTGALLVSPDYLLRSGDVVQVKVYQEEDLASTSRIGPDGTITMPLLGAVRVASNTVSEATATIASLLAKDYLVNPQVTLNVTEFAKRRFTVLGQVQRPGTYEMPTDESVNLLQAIAAAGGFTRIGNPRKITVQRIVESENRKISLDSEAMSKRKEQPFLIRPDDVITVGEKWI